LAWDERLAEVPDTRTPVPEPLPGHRTISFVSSRPSELQFPLEDFRVTCEEVLRSPQIAQVLQLGSPAGYGPLREWLLAEARRSGVARGGDDVVITSGCQQALDLLQRLLAPPGETVLLEEPVYPGLKGIFAAAGVRCLGVPVTPQGLDPALLERMAVREKARLLVVTPNFQNPTGLTMPLVNREEVLRVARSTGFAIVENDIYGELRYTGQALPTLKQLDETGDVIQIKSFSKIAFPGLRTGWVVAPHSVARRLALLKQIADLHSDQLSQAVLLVFAESGRLRTHLQGMLREGAARLEAVLDACQRSLPEQTAFTRPQGGMNLWVRLPGLIDAAALLPHAAERGVTYLPGSYFSVSRSETNALRLSFAGLPPAQIRDGLAVLGQVLQQELEQDFSAPRGALAPAIV
jgi:2-aminoadipate transaminase